MGEVEQTEQKPLIKKNGGARPNSGPKLGAKYKKTIAKEAAQMYLIRRVEESIEGLTTALLEKAHEGDIGAVKEAFDRAWGKSREKMEMTVLLPKPLDEVRPKHDVQQDNSVPEDKEPQ